MLLEVVAVCSLQEGPSHIEARPNSARAASMTRGSDVEAAAAAAAMVSLLQPTPSSCSPWSTATAAACSTGTPRPAHAKCATQAME